MSVLHFMASPFSSAIHAKKNLSLLNVSVLDSIGPFGWSLVDIGASSGTFSSISNDGSQSEWINVSSSSLAVLDSGLSSPLYSLYCARHPGAVLWCILPLTESPFCHLPLDGPVLPLWLLCTDSYSLRILTSYSDLSRLLGECPLLLLSTCDEFTWTSLDPTASLLMDLLAFLAGYLLFLPLLR